MLTITDTQNLIKVMKAEFVTKDEFDDSVNRIESKFDKLGLTLDKVLAELLDFRTEMKSLNHNMSIVKTWMVPVSKKTGVSYPF